MPVDAITDLLDPRLDPFRDLKATNLTRRSESLIAEGDKLVHRLIQSGLEVRSLLLSERYVDVFSPLVGGQTRLLVVADSLVEQIVGFNFHRGVLACANRPSNADPMSLCRQAGGARLVVAPEIHNPENLGAILRLAAAFGVNGVILGPGSCDPYSRRVLRVSMGAAFKVPISQPSDLSAEIERLRKILGLQVWATETSANAVPFDAIPCPEKLALVLGCEGHGLPEEWLARADRQITIPMRPGTDSLNVATAAGILLYYLSRP
jgi:tRNA G18 (ribose-2'-O)-methylase SpoU